MLCISFEDFDVHLQAVLLLFYQLVCFFSCLQGSTLIFAPFANSYKRFVKDAHAPTSAQWGYENRTTAIRIPGGDLASKRIEHRVAGGDTNPYLVMTAILGSALLGIEKKLNPIKLELKTILIQFKKV